VIIISRAISNGHRIANANAMALQYLVLERGRIFFANLFIGKDPEAGSDAVNGFSVVNHIAYKLLAFRYPLFYFFAEQALTSAFSQHYSLLNSQIISSVEKILVHN
jgi:hypothetical protein